MTGAAQLWSATAHEPPAICMHSRSQVSAFKIGASASVTSMDVAGSGKMVEAVETGFRPTCIKKKPPRIASV